jgi:protoporphyrinogen oxidase
LEAAAAFPALVVAEQTYGSVILGLLRAKREKQPGWMPKGGTFTFDSGVQVLTDKLADVLGSSLRLGVVARRVEPASRGVLVDTEGGALFADHAIVAVSPSVAADLVGAWRQDLAGIPSSPVVAVHLGWARGQGPGFVGFGWLTPSLERSDVLGMIGVSATFPHLAPDHDVVRVMIGGARAPSWAEVEDEALVAHSMAVVRAVHGRVPDPKLVQIARHRSGIPQYQAGHSARRRRLEGAVPGVHPLGWGVTGIGVSQSLEAAEALAQRLAEPP